MENSFLPIDPRRLPGILDAALEFVPTHGWSREAIVEAAEKYGYPGVAHGMFPGGGADLATHFYAKSNAEFRQWLISESADGVPKVGVFVREAVERRVKMTIPYKARPVLLMSPGPGSRA